jgi:hypothetical protein
VFVTTAIGCRSSVYTVVTAPVLSTTRSRRTPVSSSRRSVILPKIADDRSDAPAQTPTTRSPAW